LQEARATFTQPTAPLRKPRSKEERIQREREALVSQLAAERLDTVRARVAFVMNHYPDARNSDRVLFLTYWRKFQPDVLGPEEHLDEEKVLLLENPMSLIRARQKIQNEFGLFQPTEEVQAFRRERRLEISEAQVMDKPDRPLLGVYADESYKKDGFALVGSVWTLDSRRYSQLMVRLVKFRAEHDINYEFHFNELTKHKVDNAKAFFLEALSVSDTLSLKAVTVPLSGINRPIDKIFEEMYYRLVLEGLKHEFDTRRVSRPRILQVWKDRDKTNDALDALAMARLRDDLRDGLAKRFEDEVFLDLLESVDSKANHLVQIADLFTGSINRVLNAPGETTNFKDEFAAFVLSTLGLKLTSEGLVESARQDVATVLRIG